MRLFQSQPALGLAIVMAFVTPVAAQDDLPDLADDPSAGIELLLHEHDRSELGFVESYRAFKPRFEAFVAAHRGTEPEARATLWLVQQTWWLRSEGVMESTAIPLAEDLLDRHPGSRHLGLLVEYQYVFTAEQRKSLFERVLRVSPHREVKAAAHFGLARLVPARAAGVPNAHYKALIGEYSDVAWRRTTFGQIANAYLNPHRSEDLAVGSAAPEIVGVNHEGQAMKLSDFRGKVVLLDFWGDW